MRYRLLDHTADALIEVHGETLQERFANAAFAMFDQITDVSAVRAVGEAKISISAEGIEELLVEFLQELLYIHDTDNLVLSEFEVHINGNSLKATVKGEEFDADRHDKRSVVKGVTYHGLKVDNEAKLITLLLDV